MKEKPSILLYGYGNPGREDDGLGPALVGMAEEWIRHYGIENVDTESNYQLNIEDAYAVKDYDMVIFIDASVEDIDDYILTRVTPSARVNFTMHAVSPSFVLDLCREIYGRIPETYLLHVRGFSFEMREGLTDRASGNLDNAMAFLREMLIRKNPMAGILAE